MDSLLSSASSSDRVRYDVTVGAHRTATETGLDELRYAAGRGSFYEISCARW